MKISCQVLFNLLAVILLMAKIDGHSHLAWKLHNKYKIYKCY